MDNQPIFRKITERDLVGKIVKTDDWALSASNLGSLIQRGNYTLTTGNVFVTFPRPYLSSSGGQNNLSVLITSRTATHQYIESIAKISAMGSTAISSVSGFTVSGSGSDTGFWLSIGY